MFSIKTFSDVVTVAKTFGVQALDFAIENSTLSMDANQLIRDCKAWAKSSFINIENVNDGNIEYSVDAEFTREAFAGIYVTSLDDISIVRTGFGSYDVTVREAMAKGYITAEQLNRVLTIIQSRNEAAKALGM